MSGLLIPIFIYFLYIYMYIYTYIYIYIYIHITWLKSIYSMTCGILTMLSWSLETRQKRDPQTQVIYLHIYHLGFRALILWHRASLFTWVLGPLFQKHIYYVVFHFIITNIINLSFDYVSSCVLLIMIKHVLGTINIIDIKPIID